MGPKATRRAAAWADGIYMWSGNGEKADIERAINMMEAAWQDAGRDTRPSRVAGFWCSLADDAQARAQRYVHDYLKVLSPELADVMSKQITRCTPDAIRESLDAMEALECEEVFLVPTTCDLEDIDRLSELVASR
jgi:alkanesulfonate monooxygenase SsuD/methylene tetrahydromethanopterin reductase-like flavin-dependent oxidoreductase (luciferase family)